MKPMISTDKDLFSSSRVRALQNATDTIWITPRIYETICDMFCLTWPSHAWSCRCASRRWGWRGLWLAPAGVCELTRRQMHETYVDAHQLHFSYPRKALTWWRHPWWTCTLPPWHRPSGTCPEMARNVPGGQISNVMTLLHIEMFSPESKLIPCLLFMFAMLFSSKILDPRMSLLNSPWRKGLRSRGSGRGSSWSRTAAKGRIKDGVTGEQLIRGRWAVKKSTNLSVGILKSPVRRHVFDDVC